MAALELDVEERPPWKGREDLLQRGNAVIGQLARRQLVDPRIDTLDTVQRLVVAENRDAVAAQADVELEPIAARDLEGREQGPEAVLRGAAPVTAVGESERSGRGRHFGPSPVRAPISRCAAMPR